MRNVLLNLMVVLSIFHVQGCWADKTKNEISQGGRSVQSDPIDVTVDAEAAVMSNWVGIYKSAVPANVTEELRIYKSKFSFGDDCQEVTVQFVTVSKPELVFKVDPESNCGFAGWVIALSMPNPELKVISFKAYRSLDDFNLKEDRMSLTYSKVDE